MMMVTFIVLMKYDLFMVSYDIFRFQKSSRAVVLSITSANYL